LDTDSDNDGIPDVIEAGGTDSNNDGKVDSFTDANSDGLTDTYTGATALLKTGPDLSPVNGRADDYPNKNLDRDFRPNAYDLDSDGDGIADVIEAGLPDINFNGIIDGSIGTNGWSVTVAAMGALNLPNTDNSGNPDYLDIDADDDGIPDNIEGQSTAGYKLPTTTDTDGDGIMSPYDNSVAYGGAGIFVYDHDADGIPDYRDLDTDSDGAPDIIEGNDWNLNGIADENVSLTGIDTDGDGLDNRFDSLNSVTNIKGTSYKMGNNGSLVGDAAPGTKATVQMKTAFQIDRDWRYFGVVLPVQVLAFNAAVQNTDVLLNWTIITPVNIDRFEIERSTDNNNFLLTGTVTGKIKLNEQQSFSFTDDISKLNEIAVIYYRLKMIGKSGEIKYSNVIVVKNGLSKNSVTIMPNPAEDFVNIRLSAEKTGITTIRLINGFGQLVLMQNRNIVKGINTIMLNNLSNYGAGMYTLQIQLNEQWISQKLIIAK
jgi:hypothetical protein